MISLYNWTTEWDKLFINGKIRIHFSMNMEVSGILLYEVGVKYIFYEHIS